jgi:hypothetical protein
MVVAVQDVNIIMFIDIVMRVRKIARCLG